MWRQGVAGCCRPAAGSCKACIKLTFTQWLRKQRETDQRCRLNANDVKSCFNAQADTDSRALRRPAGLLRAALRAGMEQSRSWAWALPQEGQARVSSWRWCGL